MGNESETSEIVQWQHILRAFNAGLVVSSNIVQLEGAKRMLCVTRPDLVRHGEEAVFLITSRNRVRSHITGEQWKMCS